MSADLSGQHRTQSRPPYDPQATASLQADPAITNGDALKPESQDLGEGVEKLSSQDITSRVERAIASCNEEIDWYKKAKDRAAFWYMLIYTIAVCAGGITPVLVVMQVLFPGQQAPLMILTAFLPALAAVLTSLNGFYHWRENYLRFGYTSEALQNELLKFLTRTSPGYRRDNSMSSDERALDNFVQRLESFRMNETGEWRSQMQQPLKSDEHLQEMREIFDKARFVA